MKEAKAFNNRVFGCAIIKSINSNYNADFSGRPRTLPDGTVYATDKALKYAVRNYLKNALDERIFYFKNLKKDSLQPRDLDETYKFHFGAFSKNKKEIKKEVLKNLLSCIDVRLFGGTYAGTDKNLSIHGSTQITHGVNRFTEHVIYSEQIMSPFKNSSESKKDSAQTTLGNQSKLQEGHYVHHFSVNPKNISNFANQVDCSGVSVDDMDKLKEALCKGVTLYDSSAKSGSENELLLWVQLKEGSRLVLPSFVQLITIDDNRVIDLGKIRRLLDQQEIEKHIEKIELFYDEGLVDVVNPPSKAVHKALSLVLA